MVDLFLGIDPKGASVRIHAGGRTFERGSRANGRNSGCNLDGSGKTPEWLNQRCSAIGKPGAKGPERHPAAVLVFFGRTFADATRSPRSRLRPSGSDAAKSAWALS